MQKNPPKIPHLLALLAIGVLSPGCTEAAKGHRLCGAADVARLCGIPNEQCQAALAADETFFADNLYDQWAVGLASGGQCVLRARDLGVTDVMGCPGQGDGGDVRFRLGRATATSALVLARDSDEDGVTDGDEADLGLDPLNADSDGDGVEDGDEIEIGIDPLSADTDEDGSTDGDEIACGSPPLDPAFTCANPPGEG